MKSKITSLLLVFVLALSVVLPSVDLWADEQSEKKVELLSENKVGSEDDTEEKTAEIINNDQSGTDKHSLEEGEENIGTPVASPDGNYKITIKYLYEGEEQEQAANPFTALIQPNWDTVQVVESPEVKGYEPSLASITLDYKTFSGDTEYIVTYSPRLVTYTVEHKVQNLDMTAFETYRTVELEAKVGTPVTPEPLEIPGFTAISPYPTEKIPAEGTLQLEMKYSRDVYTLSYNTDGGSYIPAEQRAFDETLTAPENPTKSGYNFLGWEPALPAKMPAGDLELKAKWEPTDGTPYKYAYYLQNADDDEYTLLGFVDAAGKTGDLVMIPQQGAGLDNLNLFPIKNDAYADYGIPKLVTNQDEFNKYFVFDVTRTETENNGKRIASDGQTIVPLYFNRQVYTIVFGNNPDHFNDASEWFPEITINGNSYTRENLYKIRVRFGQDFSDLMPNGSHITNMPEGMTFYRPMYVKGTGYGSWMSAKPPYRLHAHMVYCAPQTVVDLNDPYTQYVSLERESGSNILTIYEHFQGLDGEYPIVTEPTRIEKLGNGTWYYTPSNYLGYLSDSDKLDYYQKVGSDGPGYSFIIRRAGKPSYSKGDIILDKDGKFVETVTESYPENVDGRVDVYYARAAYPVTFWINPAQESKDLAKKVIYEGDVTSVLPSQDIINQHKPSDLPDNYEFKGWYLDQAYIQKMPENYTMGTRPIQLFAKWGLAAGDIEVVIDPDNGNETTTLTVAYGEKIDRSQVGTPEKPGYTFVGWYIAEENGNLTQIYDFQRQITAPLTIKAKYRANTSTSITVQYLDQSGNSVADPDTYTNLPIGQDFTYKAKVVPDLLPDAIYKNLKSNLIPEENVLNFNYSPFSSVDYKITYVTKSVNDDGTTSTEEIRPTNKKTTKYNVVTEDAPAIEGYVALTAKQTIPLSLNPDDNIIEFVYKKASPAEAEYRIEYYFDTEGNGDYRLDEERTKVMSDTLGSEVNLVAGSDLMPEYINGMKLNTERSITSGTVITGPTLTLKLFYAKEASVPSPGEDNPNTKYTITYLANGGTFSDGTTVKTYEYNYGDVITIIDSPRWEGNQFLYWQGSKYYPSDQYTVVGDHTFTAIWATVIGPFGPSADVPGFRLPQANVHPGGRPNQQDNANNAGRDALQHPTPAAAPVTTLPRTGSVSSALIMLTGFSLGFVGLILKKRS